MLYDRVERSYAVEHLRGQHKGICLGFDIDAEIKEPSYVTDREQFNADILHYAAARRHSLDPADLAFQSAQHIVTRILETKFDSWRFEKERRVLIRLTSEQKHGSFYFADFSERIQPRTMILGARCAARWKEIQAAIAEYSPAITLTRAMLSPHFFEMIEDPRGPEGFSIGLSKGGVAGPR
jgi:hypothetical protein